MRSPYQYINSEPMELRSNVIFFHDWRYVNHGYPGWRAADGSNVAMFGVEPLPDICFDRRDIPFGIRLRTLPAQKTAPFMFPSSPWEGMIFSPNLIHEQGKYRLWYEVVAPRVMGAPNAGLANYLCYAESTDGVNWQKPELSICAYEGQEKTNIVYGGELAGPWGFHGAGVFLDPVADPAERYKVLYLTSIPSATVRKYQAQNPDRVAPIPEGAENCWALCGAFSADGYHWTRYADPVCIHLSDTHNTCYYDPFLHSYVGFVRTWVMGRRSIGRIESKDFRSFPLPETIKWPGADVSATDTWYGNAKTVYPNAPDYHLLFPHRWRIADDSFTPHLFTSPDGILWSAPPDNIIATPGTRGDWDAGAVSIGCGLVSLPEGRIGVPYTGYQVPHKYPRRPPLSGLAWATWEQDRLVALEAEEEGEFSTWVVQYNGNSLRVNARTKHCGEIRIQVFDEDRLVIPGRSLADCDPIDGNLVDHPVTWNGDESIRLTGQGKPCAFLIRLRAAELFSLRFGE